MANGRLVVGLTVALMIGGPDVLLAQYLDPGAGSVVIQVLVAGLVGIAAVGKFYWKRITGLFQRGGRQKTHES